MATEKDIREALDGIVHPESRKGLVTAGIVREISVGDGGVSVVLAFSKKRDPFAKSIVRQAEVAVRRLFPEEGVKIEITVKEEAPVAAKPATTTGGIRNIVAIASGKGGVGKSTVTANLAITLRDMGYSVGILDADIYGPSMPKMFGLEGYVPQPKAQGEEQYIMPGEAEGIKIMSIGFFISPDDALIWRGPMATGALKQLIHQTVWGELDYLLIDMPPGTGDVHLSVAGELKISGAIIVTTPQQIALADVRRGIAMFRAKGIGVPVLGIIENMAWFSPAELPGSRYYIFGNGGTVRLARTEGIDILGEIPIIQSIMEGGESGRPASRTEPEVTERYHDIARKIVDKLAKNDSKRGADC